jgi:hypothetical protein
MLSSIVLALAGVLATPAQAQTMSISVIHPDPVLTAVRPEPGRIVEGYYSHYSFDTPGSRTGMDGFGARIMWNPARADYGATALPSRFAFGLFGEYAPSQETRKFSVGHVGVQGDVNVFRTPLFGRLSPVASLGAGVLWTDRVGPAVDSREFTLGNRTQQMFALSPSVGTRVSLWRQLGLRADVRDLLTFRDKTLNHVQLAAGLSFSY